MIGAPSLTHEKPQNKPPSTSRKYSFNKVFFSTDAFPNAALSAALANSAGLSKDEHHVNVLSDELQFRKCCFDKMSNQCKFLLFQI